MIPIRCKECDQSDGFHLWFCAIGHSDLEYKIQARAEELYEANRKLGSGRPMWEHLDPTNKYDMEIRNRALELSRNELLT